MPASTCSIFGIRHHGPGSARSVLAALEAQKPDIILIEGPADAESMLPLAADPQMKPPVALLVYNPKNLRQASFFPFAEFSPEWQAVLYGFRNDIPVRMMDIPAGISFALQAETDASIQLNLELPEPDNGDGPAAAPLDPFTEIANLAGYADPERWWEAMFERNTLAVSSEPTGNDTFDRILELMQALRERKQIQGMPESSETILREAFMRQTIRKAQNEGFHHIAAVCGAWHAPALAGLKEIKASADAGLLKNLKKIKTQATWIPWSFDRLAAQHGYGAGVIAPVWYQTLWDEPAPHANWFSRAARLLRENDIILSPAHVIEAIRLSETLATLRNTIMPGIEELREAAVTVLCEGAEKPFELIEKQLITGDVLGTVPESAPVVPLRADFEDQLRSARLTLSTVEQSLELDLRKESHLRKSCLLHRLALLRIPWGKPEEITGRTEGRFHENWTLQWLPDYEIRLIEAGAWGNTVEEAATRRTRRDINETEQLTALVRLLSALLKAELPGILPGLLQKLRQVGAIAQDALALADTILPLVEVLRYGHARKMNLESVGQLLEQLVPRVCLQVPGACLSVDDEAAAEILKKIIAVHRALGLWQQESFNRMWVDALSRIDQNAVPVLAGLASRLLFEQKAHTAAETATTMQFRLSPAQAPHDAAQWLEGFLHGSGLLLLHQPALWQILDDWVAGIGESQFSEILPLLRRTFSRFSGPEREKMLDLAKSGQKTDPVFGAAEAEWDAGRAAAVRPLLHRILS